jgi:phosphate starvation-inducible protein PhoH and related proteins
MSNKKLQNNVHKYTKNIKPLTTNQQIFLERLDEKQIIFLLGPAGTGKMQPLYSKIQTMNGPVTMGSLKIGDEILSTNGNTTKVTGIFKQGVQPVYRVHFRDGFYADCGLDHLWNVYSRHNKDKWRTISLKEILSLGVVDNSNNFRFKIPLTEPIQYPKKKLPVHPYLLGYFIANGCFRTPTPRINMHVDDKDLFFSKIKSLLSAGVKVIEEITGNGISFTFPKEVGRKGKGIGCGPGGNSLTSLFQQLGLWWCDEKFIPHEYLYSSIDDRLELLRGIMDGDGCIGDNGSVSLSSNLSSILPQYCELVQSLGGTAIINPQYRKSKNITEYSLNIKLFMNPFSLPRKADKWHISWKNPPSRYITKVEYIGETEQQCIMVDAKNQLYLTDNYIVTHNSFLTVSKALEYLDSGKVNKIILTRPAIEAGENLGFLPGDMIEKLGPYLRPIYDIIVSRIGLARMKTLIAEEVIEIAPLAYMRGRSLDGCFIILDEAQNCTYGQLKMILTRIGKNSKLVINGDPEQTDLENNHGVLKDISFKLGGISDISVVELSNEDIVRNELISRILEAI